MKKSLLVAATAAFISFAANAEMKEAMLDGKKVTIDTTAMTAMQDGKPLTEGKHEVMLEGKKVTVTVDKEGRASWQ